MRLFDDKKEIHTRDIKTNDSWVCELARSVTGQVGRGHGQCIRAGLRDQRQQWQLDDATVDLLVVREVAQRVEGQSAQDND